MNKIIYATLSVLLLCSCAGSLNTVRYLNTQSDYKNAVIISAENSNFIRFKPGIIIPMGVYIVLPDDPAEKREVIGNTDRIIKQELEKYGIRTEIARRGDIIEDFDLIVEYYDTWRWDFKRILDKLEIVFISPKGQMIAKSTFNISKNKEFHNFPTPAKEVPKMIRELLKK